LETAKVDKEIRTMDAKPETCCPPFNPEPWQGKEVTWTDRLFVKDRVRSLFHIPLNFGKVMTRNMALIEKAGASSEDMIVLADENSLWGSDVYIAVTRDVPGAQMARLSGTFLCRVFEGPFSQIRNWIREMTACVEERGKQLQHLYFYYTTCPRCARKYGKNYVVLLAREKSVEDEEWILSTDLSLREAEEHGVIVANHYPACAVAKIITPDAPVHIKGTVSCHVCGTQIPIKMSMYGYGGGAGDVRCKSCRVNISLGYGKRETVDGKVIFVYAHASTVPRQGTLRKQRLKIKRVNK
jgi:hypothetical protein